MTSHRLTARASRSLSTTPTQGTPGRSDSPMSSSGVLRGADDSILRHIAAQDGWLCADTETPDAWHPTSAADIPAAESLCSPCMRREDCAEIGRSIRGFGVWGGVYLENGEPVEKRAVGRPRSAPPAA